VYSFTVSYKLIDNLEITGAKLNKVSIVFVMQGRTVVLVDDMADTCYTLLNAVNQLIRNLQIKMADFFWGGGEGAKRRVLVEKEVQIRTKKGLI
jgi:adenine/guanine phosphoribosyltransferase-like PRPP-binding protein